MHTSGPSCPNHDEVSLACRYGVDEFPVKARPRATLVFTVQPDRFSRRAAASSSRQAARRRSRSSAASSPPRTARTEAGRRLIDAERVVVGLDGSLRSRRAVAFVGDLQAPQEGVATLLAVVEPTRSASISRLPASVRAVLGGELAALDATVFVPPGASSMPLRAG